MKKVLIIEDDKHISNAIRDALHDDGYITTQVFDGANAIQSISFENPDIILLDIMLPNMSGIEIIKELKTINSVKNIPIIFVTAKSDIIDQVIGYELGAIDYVVKPFSMAVLTRKISALLGMMEPKISKSDSIIEIGDLYINPKEFIVKVKGEEVSMTLKEFKLLQVLASQLNKVFTRDELLIKVWEVETTTFETRTVDTHIKKIRQKLKDVSHYVKTIHGLGYKLCSKDN